MFFVVVLVVVVTWCFMPSQPLGLYQGEMFFDFVIVIKILVGDYSTDLWYQSSMFTSEKTKAVCCIKTSEREKGG